MTLYEQWLEAKARESQAKSDRQAIEDSLNEELSISDQVEGSKTFDIGDLKVKVTQRHNVKIDAEKLQDIANSEGLMDHLSSLMRWKPEINKKVWDNADSKITGPLSEAITKTPGRPSYNISLKEE